MGVATYTHEYSTSVAPIRCFKGFVVDGDNLIPKVLPQFFTKVETVGDTQKMSLADGKCWTHKIHAVDDKNLVLKYSLVEGDVLGDNLENITVETKFEASGDGGCIVKTTYEFHTKGDYVVTEEEHNGHRERALGLIKAIDGYLVANPSAYA